MNAAVHEVGSITAAHETELAVRRSGAILTRASFAHDRAGDSPTERVVLAEVPHGARRAREATVRGAGRAVLGADARSPRATDDARRRARTVAGALRSVDARRATAAQAVRLDASVGELAVAVATAVPRAAHAAVHARVRNTTARVRDTTIARARETGATDAHVPAVTEVGAYVAAPIHRADELARTARGRTRELGRERTGAEAVDTVEARRADRTITIRRALGAATAEPTDERRGAFGVARARRADRRTGLTCESHERDEHDEELPMHSPSVRQTSRDEGPTSVCRVARRGVGLDRRGSAGMACVAVG